MRSYATSVGVAAFAGCVRGDGVLDLRLVVGRIAEHEDLVEPEDAVVTDRGGEDRLAATGLAHRGDALGQRQRRDLHVRRVAEERVHRRLQAEQQPDGRAARPGPSSSGLPRCPRSARRAAASTGRASPCSARARSRSADRTRRPWRARCPSRRRGRRSRRRLAARPCRGDRELARCRRALCAPPSASESVRP